MEWSQGSQNIEFDEVPEFNKNLLPQDFINGLVDVCDNNDPHGCFERDGWTVFAASKSKPKNNIVYRMGKKYKPGFPTVQVFGFAEFEGVSAEACFETLENHGVRLQWDANLLDYKVIEKFDKHHHVVYTRTKWPFPLSPRDCVHSKYVQRNHKEGEFIACWRPCSHPDFPKTKGVTRSWSYGISFFVQLPDNRCRLWMFMCGDPKGKIPAWLINSAMPTLAVKGVVGLRDKALEVQTNMAKRRDMVKRLSIEGRKLYLEGVKPTPTKK